VHAQACEQATSDYHRLLREPTDLAAIVVIHPVNQLSLPLFTLCETKKAFLVGSLSL